MKKISSTNCFLGGGMCSVIVEHNFYFTALHFFMLISSDTPEETWKPVEDLIVQSNSNTNKEFKYIY